MSEFRDLVDLASERLGGTVLYANDDFFAEKENLLKQPKAIWKEHEYTDRGKWMDGWESRRRRVPGHDFAIVRLGARGIVRGVIVDTAFFRGNFPDRCSIDACDVRPETPIETLLSGSIAWTEILSESKLHGDSENLYRIDNGRAFTHLRLHIYPDGGVARFRVHGEVVPDWRRAGGLTTEIDLASIENGAEVLTCSDMFFGPKHNLIMPGRALNMSDGWETRRRRGPGHDWVIVKLATEGTLRRIEVDTNHFKGNFPDTCSIEGGSSSNGLPEEWHEVLPRTRLLAHTRHMFLDDLAHRGPFTHLRMNVYPDGGVSRLRVHGMATDEGLHAAVVRHLDTSVDPSADLLACCGSHEWVRRMYEARPFRSWQRLVEIAEVSWRELEPHDWLEAFAAHPRIGERKQASRWASSEQSGTKAASPEILEELARLNAAYEEKFGHVFLICATGKTATEMLYALRERIERDANRELRTAAEEQQKITLLRLEKLVKV